MPDQLDSIEMYVTWQAGYPPHVRAYQSTDWHGGSGVDALDRAIQEAQAFIARLEAMKTQIQTDGLGERAPEPGPQPDIGKIVAEMWAKVVGEQR